MGYNSDDRFVRGDLFKPSGKWEYTVTLDYRDGDYYSYDLHQEARDALRRATDRGISGVSISGLEDYWTLVVLEPYAEGSYPIVVHGK